MVHGTLVVFVTAKSGVTLQYSGETECVLSLAMLWEAECHCVCAPPCLYTNQPLATEHMCGV